jgi:acyl-coenzyme A thioesterase PaaI-like protein
VGRTTVVVQTDITDDSGRRLAQVTQTQAVLHPDPPGPADSRADSASPN